MRYCSATVLPDEQLRHYNVTRVPVGQLSVVPLGYQLDHHAVQSTAVTLKYQRDYHVALK